ncbi:MAG: glycosyltransferase family 4 protein [Deltaproteobacteria bacterium]|nr:glycosyltransferase family 4 protein [Deltaproteobacteria bacterium]
MRVLIVSDRLPPQTRSGGGRVLEEMAARLASTHEVELVRAAPSSGARGRAALEISIRATARRFRPDVAVSLGPSLAGLSCPVLEMGAPAPESAPRNPLSSLRGRVRASRQRTATVLVPTSNSGALLAPDRPFVAVPVGVDTQQFSPAPPPPSHPSRVVFVGRLTPSRGAHIALESFAGLPGWAQDSWHLDIVGAATDSNYLGGLRRKAKGLPVTLHTDVPDVVPYFRRARLAVLPQTSEDGWARSILEAMACGLPVVSSTGGVLSEITGGAARLTPAGNLKAVGDALRDLLRSEERRSELGVRAREHVESHHAWEVVLPRWEEALASSR